MLRNLAISILSFAGAVSVARADVFRWVDEHNGVHYSDRWVPGSVLIKTTKSHPASSDTAHAGSRVKTSSEQTAAQLAEQNATKTVKDDMAKVREQQCKEAKDRYDKAIQARRIYKPSEGDKTKDGAHPDDRQFLSDEEADAYRVKVRTDMQEVCGKSAK